MIGFGLSEKPAREQAHSLDGHIANLTSLVRQLDLRRATIVCHDWGGPTGLGFAMSNSERVQSLFVMSTWPWPSPPAEFHTRRFPWLTMHAPLRDPTCWGGTTVSHIEAYICLLSTATNSDAKRRLPMTSSCPIGKRVF